MGRKRYLQEHREQLVSLAQGDDELLVHIQRIHSASRGT